MTESGTAVLDPRQAVAEATRHTSGTLLYTAPVLDAAAALLADVWAAAESHGVQPADLDVAYRCLEAITRRRCTGIPHTVEQAQALLDVLVEEFAALGVTTTRDDELGLVVLPRGPSTPQWGYAQPQLLQLAVSVTIGDPADDDGWYLGGGGWDLALNQRGCPAVSVAASCDRAGAAEVAQLAIEVNAGRHGNPFRRA